MTSKSLPETQKFKTSYCNILEPPIVAGNIHVVYRDGFLKLFRSPWNRFRQPMQPGGPVRQPYSYSVPSPHRLFQNYSTAQLSSSNKTQNGNNGNKYWKLNNYVRNTEIYNMQLHMQKCQRICVHCAAYRNTESRHKYDISVL